MRPVSTAVIALALLASGCTVEKFTADNMAPMLKTSAAAFNTNPLPDEARLAAPGMLALIDGVVAASPENPELLTIQAQMRGTYAFGFLEQEYLLAEREGEEKLAKKLKHKVNTYYRRSRSAAREAMLEWDRIYGTALVEILEQGKPEELEKRILAELEFWDEGRAETLFWYAFAWGAYINLNVDEGPKVTKDLTQVRVLLDWVVDKDEKIFHGGAHLSLALLHLALGKSIGGKPEEAYKHIVSVYRITSGRSLMAQVIYAQYYLPQKQTPAGNPSPSERKQAQEWAWKEFMKTLKYIMDAPEDLWPAQSLENALAKRRAEDLYYRADDILIPPRGVKVPERPSQED